MLQMAWSSKCRSGGKKQKRSMLQLNCRWRCFQGEKNAIHEVRQNRIRAKYGLGFVETGDPFEDCVTEKEVTVNSVKSSFLSLFRK